MQDHGLGLRVGLKDLPTLRTRIRRQILTELKTFSFYHTTFLTGGTDASRAILRDVRFLALYSSSVRKTMSAKATATAALDWKHPEAEDQAPGPNPISAPYPVPRSTPLPSYVAPRWIQGPMEGKSLEGRHGNRITCRGVQEGRGDSHGILVGPTGCYVVAKISIWLCVSCHSHAKCVFSHASYLFFVLQKRMRSPLTGPSPGISIGMPASMINNASNSNTKRNEKKKEKMRKKK